MVAEKGEKYLYIENKTGNNLILGFTISNMAAYLMSMNYLNVDYNIFWFSMFNIALTLLTFLMATKQKNYVKEWVYAAIPVGIIQLIQIINYPELNTDTTTKGIIYALLAVSIICLTSGSYVTFKRIKLRENNS